MQFRKLKVPHDTCHTSVQVLYALSTYVQPTHEVMNTRGPVDPHSSHGSYLQKLTLTARYASMVALYQIYPYFHEQDPMSRECGRGSSPCLVSVTYLMLHLVDARGLPHTVCFLLRAARNVCLPAMDGTSSALNGSTIDLLVSDNFIKFQDPRTQTALTRLHVSVLCRR